MLNCLTLSSKYTNSIDPAQFQRIQKQAKDARITAIALGFLSIFLFACSCALFGLGTLSPTAFMGLGMIPYLGGTFLSFLSAGLVGGVLFFATTASIRDCQKKQFR
jgi:uncharacterized membrane protein required for colicin V production